MQLYSAAISPYASRCRIQIRHKNLPIEIVPPPGGMRSDEVLARNPAGRIPVLIDGDESLAESWAIMEYLETRFPTPAMRPSDPLAAARLTEIVRFTDLYVAPAMFPMFLALRGAADEAAVTKALADLGAQLAVLDQMLPRNAVTPGIELNLADAALLPVIWYGQVLARHFGGSDGLSETGHMQHWWQQASAAPAAAAVLNELEAGLQAAIPALFEH